MHCYTIKTILIQFILFCSSTEKANITCPNTKTDLLRLQFHKYIQDNWRLIDAKLEMTASRQASLLI